MSEPLISIIIPAYNAEKYLDRCLESVCAQTLKEIEVILIDDGSTDSTSNLCNTWAKKDERIKVIHQENKGVSAARNIGVRLARGNHIGFVDADDRVEVTMFQHLYEIALQMQCDIATCGIIRISEKDVPLKYLCNHKKNEVSDKTSELIKLLNDKSEKSYLCNKIFKITLFKGIIFPEGCVFEDLHSTHKLYAKAEGIVHIAENLYYYLYRQDSIVNHFTPKKEIDFFNANLARFHFVVAYKNFTHTQQLLLKNRTIRRLIKTDHKFKKLTVHNQFTTDKMRMENIIRKIYSPGYRSEDYKKHLWWLKIKNIPLLLFK